MTVGSYAVRLLCSEDASAAVRAWNDLADGTLDQETVRKIETVLAESGAEDFAAFGVEAQGELCGLATARVTVHPLGGRRGEIEALMIDGRLPDEAGDTLALHAIHWLRQHGATTISHFRDPNAPAVFWKRLGFQPDMLRYTLSAEPSNSTPPAG
jgi:hypothetical protein